MKNKLFPSFYNHWRNWPSQLSIIYNNVYNNVTLSANVLSEKKLGTSAVIEPVQCFHFLINLASTHVFTFFHVSKHRMYYLRTKGSLKK